VAATPVTDDVELYRAQARYVRSPARKARLVLEHIRGLHADEARNVLQFQTRAVARDASKVLRSAIANAESNAGRDAEELLVLAAFADEGPTLKRWRPRARGRVGRIKKRTCHITITLGVAPDGATRRRRRPAAAAAEQEPAEQPTGRRRGRRSRATEPEPVAATPTTSEESAS
jgi:large subunit ribosomal protein L22